MSGEGAIGIDLARRGFALEFNDDHLVLKDLTDDAVTPLVVDFCSGALLHRLRYGFSKAQPIGKALGLKSLNPENAPYVLDATAGLGTDAFVIAALGCRVRSIERSYVIFELLKDGERRLHLQTDTQFREIASRLTFENSNSTEVLSKLNEDERPDVVYLDPMYPEEGRSKSALPKKTMQMFRRLLDGDEDADLLFDAAIKATRSRVIVKRPLKAPHLGPKKPTHTFEGKTARLDMYLV